MDFQCRVTSVTGAYSCTTHQRVNCSGIVALNPCAQPKVDLGTTAQFAVLSYAAFTSTGLSKINGDIGVSPGTSITGMLESQLLNGAAFHSADDSSATGIADLTTAYADAKGRSNCAISVAGNLGGE
jgi:hypothetical protein